MSKRAPLDTKQFGLNTDPLDAVIPTTPPPKVDQPHKKSTPIRKRGEEKPITRKVTRPRGKSREKTRDLPTRDEVQEFSFRLRDELKVKVQAEVPHQWQTELERVALDLNVRKLELYRFIFGEFLGKVKRKQQPS